MPRTYSVRFFLVKTVAANETHTWTVPSGKRAVIKQISAINNSPGAAVLYVAVEGYYVQRFNFQAQGESASREVRLTLYAGEEAILLATAPDMRASVDGHLFEDTAGAQQLPAQPDAGVPVYPTAPPDVVVP